MNRSHASTSQGYLCSAHKRELTDKDNIQHWCSKPHSHTEPEHVCRCGLIFEWNT